MSARIVQSRDRVEGGCIVVAWVVGRVMGMYHPFAVGTLYVHGLSPALALAAHSL